MSQENSNTLFERAVRLKLRFETPAGNLSVEDLWDLPLTALRTNYVSLDDVAKSLSRNIKAAAEESFVVKVTPANEKLQLGFDIVKHIIEVRLAEKAASEQRAAKTAQKQKLLSLIAEKQDDKLRGASLEELNAMVEAL